MTKTPNSSTSTTTLPRVFIGLPIWGHPYWSDVWFGKANSGASELEHYSKTFNTIEGNTTFYSLPSEETLQKWKRATPEDFKFTFKLHQTITHENGLRHCEQLIKEQLSLLSQLENKLGSILIQLPKQFAPEHLSLLETALSVLQDFTTAVEVRHPLFFAKGEQEKLFNQCLLKHQANRIIMDTRGLFTGPATDTITDEVRQKKPRVPVNVIATGQNPTVRFVGGNDEHVNNKCLSPWVKKCHQWRLAGLSPYLFFHRPDNKDAPWLAATFVELYNMHYPEYRLPSIKLPAIPQQSGLFV